MEWSSFCAICIGLFNRPEETLLRWIDKDSASTPELFDPPPVEYPGLHIRTAAKSGCHFCVALFSYLGGKSTLRGCSAPISSILVFLCQDWKRHLRIELYNKDEGWEDGYRGFFSVRPVSASCGKLAMINEPDQDPHERTCITVTPVSSVAARGSTRDETCMDTMRYWFEKCSREHKLCRNSPSQNSITRMLPTRLIEVENQGNLRLLLTREMKETPANVRYGTLSHRWSKEAHLLLLESNLSRLLQGFTLEELPLVFQDAITTLRKLRIRYLWIDCLCILQDSQEDWERESSLMGQVYQNAYCNLGATEAAWKIWFAEASWMDISKEHVGLFVERNDPHRFFPTMLKIVRKGQLDTEYFAYTADMEDNLNNLIGGLMSRGWVFQERLMSSRSIYFGRFLTWECSEMVACEAFPDGVPVQAYANDLARGFPVRITTLLKNINDLTDHQTTLYTTWLKLVQQYSVCHFTYATDVLPALSGLARAFAQPLQDDYVAGLWRRDLLRGLLWCTWSSDEQPTNVEEYVGAPSWSWASKSKISFGILHEGPGRYIQKPICQVDGAQVTLCGSNPMGKISGGQITLTGHMRKSKSREQDANGPDDYFPDVLGDYYDTDELQTNHLVRGATFHFAVTSHPTWNRVLLGLILQTTAVESQYRRIGVFMHPFGPYDDQYHNGYKRPLRREDFTEFTDFDPDNFKSETVTII